ncbi:Nuclear receptor 2C2-associated protein [Galemys pyrenaicus]|uniref:Nuclear receptor 2C2-associated protein n=1 Tax=Galemys pyrenaicus TaxID=202257 RepID=A0A8J6AAR6_GALPY|nr:Nuclear receptor 2C2-associated protein [Galemys pyrenaicus]
MTHSLVCPETVSRLSLSARPDCCGSRVSSVLNRNTRQFGKKHLFDQDEETCWNSDQGPIQWVLLEFPQRIRVSQLQIQFQGGFSSRRGRLEAHCRCRREVGWEIPCHLFALTTCAHTFPVPAAEVDQLKVTFEDATDFFGRVVIYHLRVLGEKKE